MSASIPASIPAFTVVQDDGKQDEPAKEPVGADSAKTVWEYLSARYDADGDGKISKKEYTRGSTQFDRLDKDKNGFIELADTKGQGRRARGGGRRGGAGRGGTGRPVAAPTEGSVAPDFELETLYPLKSKAAPVSGAGDATPKGGKERAETPQSKDPKPPTYESVKLSSLKGKKPVALIFGSYT